MKRVKGRYNGSTVVLAEKIALPANTEVEVLIPEEREQSLVAVLDQLERAPKTISLTLDDVVALVHEVRAKQ